MQRQKKTGKSGGRKRPRTSAEPNLSAEDELAAIVKHSNDAIFSRTFNGIITTWNGAATRVFGYTADEMIGRSSRVLLPRGHRDEFRQLVVRMKRGMVVEQFETERARKDGKHIQVSLTLSPVRNALGRLTGFSTIARDITAQRHMTDVLVRRERELADLFEEASVGLLTLSPDGKIMRANRAFGDLVDCPISKIVGRSLSLFHPDVALLKTVLVQLAQRQTFHSQPVELLTRKGETRFVLVDANAFWEQGKFIYSRWFVRDVTLHKRLERELLEISERERRGLAQELHDGIGQQLGGIAYLCNVLRQKLLERGAPEAAEAGRVSELMRNAIKQTRRVARGLSPIQPDPEGLSSALKELAEQTTELFGIRCVFLCRRPVRVYDQEVAAHIFRIAQEAVNNALKHANAHTMTVGLNRVCEKLTLTVTDDGWGIGRPAPGRDGLGIRIMHYRSGLIHGALSIRRRRGRGTEVICSAPSPLPARTSRE